VLEVVVALARFAVGNVSRDVAYFLLAKFVVQVFVNLTLSFFAIDFFGHYSLPAFAALADAFFSLVGVVS
jgi:hypothetical protein